MALHAAKFLLEGHGSLNLGCFIFLILNCVSPQCGPVKERPDRRTEQRCLLSPWSLDLPDGCRGNLLYLHRPDADNREEWRTMM